MSRIDRTDASGFQKDMQRLGDGMGTLKDDVKEVGHEAYDAARSGAAQLSKGAHQAVDVAKHKLGEAGESVVQATESLRQTVGRHPVASIGIAAGVGMILGLILFRPRS
jgi:ElaB/YqjD/DUF883 family membrane-anchored ribosome-binding protein